MTEPVFELLHALHYNSENDIRLIRFGGEILAVATNGRFGEDSDGFLKTTGATRTHVSCGNTVQEIKGDFHLASYSPS